jgi:Phage-related protein, tail component
MNTIHLYGSLGREFGTGFKFSITTLSEAIEALRANFPSFFDFIRNKHFRLVVGKSERKGLELEEAMLPGFKLGKQDLHIVPVTKGSKRGGLGKIITGIALIGLSMVTGGAVGAAMGTSLWGGTTVGSLAGSIGVGMALTGVASLIAPEMSAPDDKKSFAMSGPQVTTREGSIVPIAYGEVITGGVLINGSLSINKKNTDEGWTDGLKTSWLSLQGNGGTTKGEN